MELKDIIKDEKLYKKMKMCYILIYEKRNKK